MTAASATTHLGRVSVSDRLARRRAEREAEQSASYVVRIANVIGAAADTAARTYRLRTTTTATADDVAADLTAYVLAAVADGTLPTANGAETAALIGKQALRIADGYRRLAVREAVSGSAKETAAATSSDDGTRQRAAVSGRRAVVRSVKRSDVLAVAEDSRRIMRAADDVSAVARRRAVMTAALDAPYVPSRRAEAEAWSAMLRRPTWQAVAVRPAVPYTDHPLPPPAVAPPASAGAVATWRTAADERTYRPVVIPPASSAADVLLSAYRPESLYPRRGLADGGKYVLRRGVLRPATERTYTERSVSSVPSATGGPPATEYAARTYRLGEYPTAAGGHRSAVLRDRPPAGALMGGDSARAIRWADLLPREEFGRGAAEAVRRAGRSYGARVLTALTAAEAAEAEAMRTAAARYALAERAYRVGCATAPTWGDTAAPLGAGHAERSDCEYAALTMAADLEADRPYLSPCGLAVIGGRTYTTRRQVRQRSAMLRKWSARRAMAAAAVGRSSAAMLAEAAAVSPLAYFRAALSLRPVYGPPAPLVFGAVRPPAGFTPRTAERSAVWVVGRSAA